MKEQTIQMLAETFEFPNYFGFYYARNQEKGALEIFVVQENQKTAEFINFILVDKETFIQHMNIPKDDFSFYFKGKAGLLDCNSAEDLYDKTELMKKITL